MTNIFRHLALCSLVALGACAGAPTSTTPQSVSLALSPSAAVPIYLNAKTIEVSSTYKAPGSGPNVEHILPQTPERVAIKWATERLRSSGSDGVARMIVTDASVVTKEEPRESAVEIKWEPEQRQIRHDAVLQATLEVHDAFGNVRGVTTARTERSIAIWNNVSPQVREQYLVEMLNQMLQDFDVEMERQIGQHLVPKGAARIGGPATAS